MTTLAERLRRLGERPMSKAGERDRLWPEVCAVVEAAEHRGKHAPEGWCAGAVAALARRLDEEGL
jgi:hypothetical protein